MFSLKQDENEVDLEKEIARLMSSMSNLDHDSDAYSKMADQLSKLYKLKEVKPSKRVDFNTAAVIAGNLAGVLIVVGYEHGHVITSKALNFITKLR